MSTTILEHPKAQALLGQAEVEPNTVRSCSQHLNRFINRYLPFFFRPEQRKHAEIILKGKLTSLKRKTTEPIAIENDLKRRPLQQFVGAGGWADDTVLGELRRHVEAELADPHGALVMDGSGFPKKGTESCGVARQWCGCLGKVDNCQVGVFLGYVAERGKALIDCQLYLTEERANDAEHRAKTYVPKEIAFQEKWRIALELVKTSGQEITHGWILGDDEFGRVIELRQELRKEEERYVLDVPCNTSVRDLGEGKSAQFERVDQWAARQPKKRWKKIRLPGGEKGPREVRVLQQLMQTKDEKRRNGPTERVVVIKTLEEKPQVWYTVSNAAKEVPVHEVAKAHGRRHGIEELLEEGKQEVGMKDYEVRSWTGWHHHMTLTMLALWFLQVERLELGKKKSGADGIADSGNLQGVAALPDGKRG
jgi:SRSO17 transposase